MEDKLVDYAVNRNLKEWDLKEAIFWLRLTTCWKTQNYFQNRTTVRNMMEAT